VFLAYDRSRSRILKGKVKGGRATKHLLYPISYLNPIGREIEKGISPIEHSRLARSKINLQTDGHRKQTRCTDQENRVLQSDVLSRCRKGKKKESPAAKEGSELPWGERNLRKRWRKLSTALDRPSYFFHKGGGKS